MSVADEGCLNRSRILVRTEAIASVRRTNEKDTDRDYLLGTYLFPRNKESGIEATF